MYFVCQQLKDKKKELDGEKMIVTEVTRAAGEKWKTLSDKDKTPFIKLHE